MAEVETAAGPPPHPADDPSAAAEVAGWVAEFLDDTSHWMAERVEPMAGVAVTLGLDDQPTTVGASSELALRVDLLQYSIGVGPCLHALRTGEGMYVPDLGSDHRWGDYGPRAAAEGAASCISVPVRVGDELAAVFKVYSAEIDGLTSHQRDTAALLGREIAGGIGLARHLSSQALTLDARAAAMNTRRTIDLALGIMMERNAVNVAAAFALLRRYSQRYNIKVNEVARRIVGDRGDPLQDQAPFQP